VAATQREPGGGLDEGDRGAVSITARRGQHRGPDTLGGVDGNERLTAMTGAVLLAGFAAEGVTILAIGRLLPLHFFLGMLLIGPVVLKIGSTCYRFGRYYTGAPPYVRKGPPAPVLRVLGPLVILTSVAVLGTGVALAVTGPGPGPWLLLHKASFILWLGVMTIHVLGHALRLPRILLTRSAPGRRAVPARWALVGASLLAGLAVALLTVHLAAPWR
jgi:hypothetical protein